MPRSGRGCCTTGCCGREGPLIYDKIPVILLARIAARTLNLPADLLMLGKVRRTKVAFDEQQRCLQEADERDLILVFSYTGRYFGEGIRNVGVKADRPQIYLIAGTQIPDPGSLVYRTLSFASLQDQISHPHQLFFIGSLVSQEWARR